jgi:hypothetical protein
MANMSYCRFENTYRDLQDCYHNIVNDLSEREHKYREQLFNLCMEFVKEYRLSPQNDKHVEDVSNNQ